MTDDSNGNGQTGAADMSDLDRKITGEFGGYTVRKDLVGEVRGNALVPSYVLEYLLGKYATTTDTDSIEAGVQRVRSILADNYVHREEANLIRSKIREKGRYQIIDRVLVIFNDRLNLYEATFENLGISGVIVDPDTVKRNQKLLVTGIWCMCTLAYVHTGDPKDVPWRLQRLMPVQMSHDDRANYLDMRTRFTTEEWIDLLMQSIGFDPALFSDRGKLLHLVRMIPFVERNYNLVELGPKGTGKSHIYSEFSPHGMLISGGEVTVAKLFVNNSTGQLGLVGYWDTVAFDEFAGRAKKAGKDLVDIMKNYMANRSFSRGVLPQQAEASMVFVGNTSHNVPYMLRNSDLFEELPRQYHDPAFLDRIHCYLPGWEFDQIRPEMFTRGYGFVVDYLAEILHNLRNADYSSAFERYFTLSPTLSTRDRDGVRKTFSGLMKLIHPSGEATPEQMEPLLRCAIEGRKRVKDQLCRIDPTMAEVDFSYTRAGSVEPIAVHTLEEDDYPDLYRRVRLDDDAADTEADAEAARVASEASAPASPEPPAIAAPALAATTSGTAVNHAVPATPPSSSSSPSPQEPVKRPSRIEQAAACAKEGRCEFSEDQRGVTYNKLFGPYVAGATDIRVTDPYIRKPYQMRNLAEFLETVLTFTDHSAEVRVHLVTGHDDDTSMLDRQIENLNQLQATFGQLGIVLTYEFSDTAHDRSIRTDTGWMIDLGRGLDIYQRYDDANWFNPQMRMQQLRRVKEFRIIYTGTRTPDSATAAAAR